MTPREKAKELAQRFIDNAYAENVQGLYTPIAQKCALICVDEIIELLKSMGKYKVVDINLVVGSCEANFWSNVKSEIEKL
jgi:hypothetical protein